MTTRALQQTGSFRVVVVDTLVVRGNALVQMVRECGFDGIAIVGCSDAVIELAAVRRAIALVSFDVDGATVIERIPPG